MTIRQLLVSVQLETLAASFEKENITPELLKDLTDADLRELGVASMADRKKIMRLANDPNLTPQTPASPQTVGTAQNAGTTAALPANAKSALEWQSERLFYEGSAEGVSVKVTSHRAIIGPKTFLLHNIAAVQVHTKTGDNKNTMKIAAVVSAVVCFGIAIAGLASEDKEGGKSIAGCCAVAGIICLAGLFAKVEPTIYSVQIDASGTPSNALSSEDKPKMQEIVDAINQAIVNLNVAK